MIYNICIVDSHLLYFQDPQTGQFTQCQEGESPAINGMTTTRDDIEEGPEDEVCMI
jgi:hypothetical protein